jgi:uncharacterized protein (DUF885 family)
MTRTIHAVLAGVLFTLAISVSANPVSTELHALFNDDWQWRMREFPEFATLLGDRRYDDRLTDLSEAAIEARKVYARELLERVRRIDRGQLDATDALSYDLFRYDAELEVDAARFPDELMPLTQMEGVHLEFSRLPGQIPMRNAKDYDNLIARLRAFPKQIDQVIALMRRGRDGGWIPPAVALHSLPGQIESQVVEDLEQSPYYLPFRSFPETVAAADRARLQDGARRAITEAIHPALEKLTRFVREDYLPAARKDIAASNFPAGASYYEYWVRRNTTTNRTAREIHEIGQAEVKRIRAQMQAIMREVGHTGTYREFLEQLRTDPRFYYTDARDLVSGFRDIAKRADAELPKLFAELPRQPYGVIEVPAHEAPGAPAAYYVPGAPDGSRPGFFYANTYDLKARPKYEMEALTLHEAVPGHHLQVARAQELEGLPDFRRNGFYTAYVEGWGLYAESLGPELGFYTDPYSKFGQLSYEMLRACRLVVDTGMHALGWSRQQAIDFMLENGSNSEHDIVIEVDRYIVLPAQALAYKLGELKLKELRARAAAALGERFDVRRFHNAVLDAGALPLAVLETHIDQWIAARKAE